MILVVPVLLVFTRVVLSQNPVPLGVLVDAQNHGIAGDVYALNTKTLLVKNFRYDGAAPDLYFWGSVTDDFGSGFKLPLSTDQNPPLPLQAYSGQDVLVKLPQGVGVTSLKRFGLWCEDFGVDFGNIPIKIQSSGRRSTGSRRASSSSSGACRKVRGQLRGQYSLGAQGFEFLDRHIIKIKGFSFLAGTSGVPDAFFYVGRGRDVDAGTKVPFDLTAQKARLRANTEANKLTQDFFGNDVYLNLNGSGYTTSDIQFISVYCRAFSVNFGAVPVVPCSGR